MAARGWGEEDVESLFSEYRFHWQMSIEVSREDEKLLDGDGGEGCVVMGTYLMPQELHT